jgi:hypothetical protein
VRILSLGIAIADQQVDNYGWSNALSFFDYDAIVVDPAVALSEMVEGVVRDGTSYTSYEEQAVQNGATTANTIGLADLLRRRADETERLLAKGGLVVCFAYPDVAHPQVSGFTGCHRYHWLPAPAGADYGHAYLKPAGGTEVRATDYEHPFADFFERHRTTVQYRAIFAEGASGFGEAAKVIARSPGGAAVAMDLSVGGGRVVFLPAVSYRLSTADRTSLASTIVAGVRDLLLASAEGPVPTWVSGFELPGIKDAQERVDVVESKLESLETELEDARNELRGLDRYRRMLWQEGKYGLDLPVRDALSMLGLTNFAKPDDPALFSIDGAYVFVEAQGSVEAVGMTPHYRLRQRVEQRIAEHNQAPKAMIVVNGYRATPPAGRAQQYTDSLKVAAETMRYCVVESSKLFEAVKAKMAGEDEAVKTFLRALLDTEGVYQGPVPAFELKPPVELIEGEDEDDDD